MSEILKYLIRSAEPMVPDKSLADIPVMRPEDWQNLADQVRGMIVTFPGMVSH